MGFDSSGSRCSFVQRDWHDQIVGELEVRIVKIELKLRARIYALESKLKEGVKVVEGYQIEALESVYLERWADGASALVKGGE